jgi:hypothetical protein
MNTRLKQIQIILLVFSVCMVPNLSFSQQDVIQIEIANHEAIVTLLEGTATIIKPGTTDKQPVSQNKRLDPGDRVSTNKHSRMEIKLPDESYVRFDELTTFELISAEFDTSAKKRRIQIGMIIGKTWANVANLIGRNEGQFAISTETAVAGVRGTVYRMNVNRDKSAVVKVYQGEVGVSLLPKPSAVEAPTKIKAPSKIEGPQHVAAPKPIAIKDWTYIVKARQQVVVQPNGRLTKPFRFSMQADADDWVRWNQSQDTRLDR